MVSPSTGSLPRPGEHRLHDAARGRVALEALSCAEELNRRPRRPPDHARESRALTELVLALAESPGTIPQTLADTILDVLEAGSAGVSALPPHDGGSELRCLAI